MASLRLQTSDRRGYEAYLEGRVLELGIKAGRQELEEKWKTLRRGWYVGGASFAEKLEDWLAKAVAGWRRESHTGQAREAHDTVAAEKFLRVGMKALGLKVSDLARMPKGTPEKVALAWWLRRRTTVSLRWVGERLEMGHYTRVTQAVSRMNRKPSRKMRALGEKLRALENAV